MSVEVGQAIPLGFTKLVVENLDTVSQFYKSVCGLVEEGRAEEKIGGTKLATAVAKYAYKLMAYKDEYEVARLYTNGEFTEKLKQQFEGDFSVKFNLAPPLFLRKMVKAI